MIVHPCSGESADIEYLLSNPTAKILAGNPEAVAELIRRCPYAQRFTGFALSFNEPLVEEASPGTGDGPSRLTVALLFVILTRFLCLVAPAGQRARLAFLAVIHLEKGRTEVHVLIVNTDLATRRQFSPYVHRRDAMRVRAFQEVTNLTHGFTDPEDVEIQLGSMPDPRGANYALIRAITASVQKHFSGAQDVTSGDVAGFLERFGYRLRREGPQGRARRLAVITPEGREVSLPGIWFRPDFDLRKFRARKRRTLPEARRELERLVRRFEISTGKSHPLKPFGFSVGIPPAQIETGRKLRSFSKLFDYANWAHMKFELLSETMFSGAERRAEWSRELSAVLGIPFFDFEKRDLLASYQTLGGAPGRKVRAGVPDPKTPRPEKAQASEGPRAPARRGAAKAPGGIENI